MSQMSFVQVRHSAAGYEFTANESAVCIKSGVFKQEHS